MLGILIDQAYIVYKKHHEMRSDMFTGIIESVEG